MILFLDLGASHMVLYGMVMFGKNRGRENRQQTRTEEKWPSKIWTIQYMIKEPKYFGIR